MDVDMFSGSKQTETIVREEIRLRVEVEDVVVCGFSRISLILWSVDVIDDCGFIGVVGSITFSVMNDRPAPDISVLGDLEEGTFPLETTVRVRGEVMIF
jgi:hypothetical protein